MPCDKRYPTISEFDDIPDFLADGINRAVEVVHKLAVAKGWWDTPRDDLALHMLIVTEVAEASEAYRNGNPQSTHAVALRSIDEEMADICIRVFDYCAARGIDLGLAIQRKHAFNYTRPHRHGGKLG